MWKITGHSIPLYGISRGVVEATTSLLEQIVHMRVISCSSSMFTYSIIILFALCITYGQISWSYHGTVSDHVSQSPSFLIHTIHWGFLRSSLPFPFTFIKHLVYLALFLFIACACLREGEIKMITLINACIVRNKNYGGHIPRKAAPIWTKHWMPFLTDMTLIKYLDPITAEA